MHLYAVNKLLFFIYQNTSELENVAINDTLPRKAARRDATANIKCLGARGHQPLILMVSFTIAMRRHLIRLASAPFTIYRLAKFGLVPFTDLRVRTLAMKYNAEFTEVGKISGPINQSSHNSGTT